MIYELYRNGVKFDCASSREIDECLSFCGIGHAVTKDILYANPVKSLNDMMYAKNLKIAETVVDSPEEVWRIVHSGWRPSIFIRLAVEDAASRSPFSIKFGAERRQWQAILNILSLTGLEFAGLSFHIGSASSDPQQYRKAIETCREFSATTGRAVEAVDIGGGFMPETFAETAKVIRQAKKDWEKFALRPPTRWLAEPGRFFSAPTHTLYTQIIGAKEGPGGVGWRYTIDESIYGQFSCIPFDHQRPYWKLMEHAAKASGDKMRRGITPGFIFGRTCDSLDLIAYSHRMTRMSVGDWLCFPGMGAYTMSSASEFNGFPKPKVYCQTDGWVDPGSIPRDKDVIFPVETKSSIKLSTMDSWSKI